MVDGRRDRSAPIYVGMDQYFAQPLEHAMVLESDSPVCQVTHHVNFKHKKCISTKKNSVAHELSPFLSSIFLRGYVHTSDILEKKNTMYIQLKTNNKIILRTSTLANKYTSNPPFNFVRLADDV